MELPHVHGDLRNKTISDLISLRDISDYFWWCLIQRAFQTEDNGSEHGSEAVQRPGSLPTRWMQHGSVAAAPRGGALAREGQMQVS